ncbi:MAG: nucleotidyl transferase AbiEii/AbiGii toxin family protein [Candidatus Micrarchaeaceae archaeon]
MRSDFNFDEIAVKSGIASDRLREDLRTYEVMSTLFPAFEVSGLEVGLYGGTALNKIYFGSRQRLSYDLDIYCTSLTSAVRAVKKLGGSEVNAKEKFEEHERRRLVLSGIAIDLWERKLPEKPLKLQAIDLLYYLGYLVPPVVIPSFSLEYLLANKTIAMADRNELKDIYDTWMGLRIVKNMQKYRKYLRIVAKERKVPDYRHYLRYQIKEIMLQNLNYYKKRSIDVVETPSTESMLKEIEEKLNL